METNGVSNGNSAERRAHERKKINLDKNIRAEVTFGGVTHTSYLYIKDISPGGMKVHSDYQFPADQEIPVRFFLEEPIEITVKPVWQKEMLGGMYIIGLMFGAHSEETDTLIRRFIEKHSPEGRRKEFRLDRMIAVEIFIENLSQKFYTLTLDLSPRGMRIVNEFPLPEALDIPFRILLDYDQPPLTAVARVAWQKETTFNRYMIGLQFISLPEGGARRINDYLDRLICGRTEKQVFKQGGERSKEEGGSPS